eukprot:m.603089 g.603089  ORF g.603089 m.603089 type:complete len:142 (-) comp22452_c3_seq2:67-492(-)
MHNYTVQYFDVYWSQRIDSISFLGERVKEMDHFVASVETPRANLKIPDVAPLVANMATAGLEPILIKIPVGTCTTGTDVCHTMPLLHFSAVLIAEPGQCILNTAIEFLHSKNTEMIRIRTAAVGLLHSILFVFRRSLDFPG